MSITKIAIYRTASGKSPYNDWFDDLDDKTQGIILTRIDRIRLGNFGDCKVLTSAGGVSELRISFGPGYRVYFGRDGMALVLLLIGGDKGTQDKDITKAKQYWQEYKKLKQTGL